jgi:hypothetical protein
MIRVCLLSGGGGGDNTMDGGCVDDLEDGAGAADAAAVCGESDRMTWFCAVLAWWRAR